MSLDVMLWERKALAYTANITHNLGKMASACGVYYACWRPEEINCSKAAHILPMLEDGIKVLEADPEHYSKFNAENGWGLYENFLPWLKRYRDACKEHPEARIEVSR